MIYVQIVGRWILCKSTICGVHTAYTIPCKPCRIMRVGELWCGMLRKI